MKPSLKKQVDDLVAGVANTFQTFGGGRSNAFGNPIAEALKDNRPVFALGVDVRDVVRFVLENLK